MRTVVMVPTYNEADNIAALVERLLALPETVDVLVVDDASPDGTGDIVDALAARDPRVSLLRREGLRGYAAASKEGLARCIAAGYDAIASMDADLSHDPDVLPQLIGAVSTGTDLAIGSRYTLGGALEVDWGPVRRAVSQTGSAYARAMLGTPVRDCTSGYRCYRASALAAVDLQAIRSEGYSFLIELLAALERNGASTAEIPITYVDRRAGTSKISRAIVVEAFVRTTALGMARVSRRWRSKRS